MKASVLINNYNYSKYIDECLLSVINQNYKDIEIIVFDDASTDNSRKILDNYRDKITLIVNEDKKSKHNSHNQFNAIKKAFDVSKGDIIFLLDSDDYFLESKIFKVIEGYKKNRDLLSIQDTIISLKGENEKVNKYFSTSNKFIPLEFVKKMNLVLGLGPQTSGLSFRRTYFKQLLKSYNFNTPLIWPDIQLGRRALLDNNALIIETPLTVRRIHDTNYSLKLKQNMSLFLTEYTTWFNNIYNTKVNLNYKQKNKAIIILKVFLYFFISYDIESIKKLYKIYKG